MNEKTIEEFIRSNNDAVLSTFRKNGAVQLSIVTVGYYKGGACFTTTSDRAKFYNIKRDPRCSLLISGSGWRPYVVLEGTANIYFTDNTEENVLKHVLRDVYRSAAKKEHPDWDEYDQAMKDDNRAAIVIVPDKVYGTL